MLEKELVDLKKDGGENQITDLLANDGCQAIMNESATDILKQLEEMTFEDI